jgi:hypothetical protein
MSIDDAATQSLSAVDCAPWCQNGTGHTDAIHVADQWCSGPDHRVTLTREPMKRYRTSRWLDNIVVAPAREHHGRPYVQMVRDDAATTTLTGAEAIELGTALLRAGKLAGG